MAKTLPTQKEPARLRAKGFVENPNSITFVFQDITNWKKGAEHINGLELFFKDRDHLREKWETFNPDGTKTQFEIRTDSKDVTHVFRVISSESCG